MWSDGWKDGHTTSALYVQFMHTVQKTQTNSHVLLVEINSSTVHRSYFRPTLSKLPKHTINTFLQLTFFLL
jgi:hypothetical protein